MDKELTLDVYCGDLLEKMKDIQTESIDLIVTDPPYNLSKNYGNNQDSLQFSEYMSFSRKWLKEADRVLKKNG